MNTKQKFPSAFVNKINSLLGKESDDFFNSLSLPPYVSVRINPFKPIQEFSDCENVGWCESSKYLPERISFTNDPLFHAGNYYVQEPSSMFLSEIFKQMFDKKQPLKILDLCASPGGKSTLILSEIPPQSFLLSNETIYKRIPPLKENIMKWGVPDVFISNNDSADFSALKNYFDVIVVDAPCSGEGLFRKDENAISEWSENLVKFCSARQKKILAAIIDSLKENGILIYSTCTFSFEENEENVKFIADTCNFETQRINLKPEWNITETEIFSKNKKFSGYRFYPHKTKGEGFFVSCLKKINSVPNTTENRNLKTEIRNKLSKKEIEIISPWLKKTDDFIFFHWKNEVYAILKSCYSDFLFLSEKLNLKSAGICIGKILNNELIPSHDLAMSTIISEKIQSVELNYETAIVFLKKQEMRINTDLKGWTLVKFQNNNLGWVKILDRRINNYFPKNSRILKT